MTSRYHIEGVIGKGGFGRVYRARMEGPSGFSKAVAIKILHDAAPPVAMLQRFRDEAKLLALVRDRAIVAVDPPVVLGERWALVMELVEGASCKAIFQSHGPLPAGVAVEVIGEVARVLDKVYQHPGPQGQPLKLLHRDIKPDNIQITRDGEVKLLDFGIAKADFASREAETRNEIGGTPGFIAPERLEGEDGPPGDVYSLGVTLHFLLTGVKPGYVQLGPPAPPDPDPERRAVLALAERMRDLTFENRPTARDVERECRDLRARSTGAWLREWAETSVPASTTLGRDDWVGQVVSLTTVSELRPPPLPSVAPPSTAPSALGAGMVGVLGTLGVVGAVVALLVIVGALGGLLLWTQPEPPPAEVAIAEPPPPGPAPVAALASPAPVAAVAPPIAAPATPTPHAPSAPVPAPTAEPAPAPVEGPGIAVTFTGRPLGATLTIDGKPAGTTPAKVTLAPGAHVVVETAADGRTIEKTIKVGARAPTRYVWDANTNSWEAGY